MHTQVKPILSPTKRAHDMLATAAKIVCVTARSLDIVLSPKAQQVRAPGIRIAFD